MQPSVRLPEMQARLFVLYLLVALLYPVAVSSLENDEAPSGSSSIIFATLGRSDYAFDIFSLPTRGRSRPADELRLTDGRSVNFNGHFPSIPSGLNLVSLMSDQTLIRGPDGDVPPSVELIYVTERNGSSSIFYDAVYYDTEQNIRSRSALETSGRIQILLLGARNGISMKDRPTLVGGHLIYVSTHEDSGQPRTSWAAVYSTELRTGLTRRLTPYGIADFSPAVSPSGMWTAVASYGEAGWGGDVEELGTDIYIFLTRDGTQRVKVVEHGGWPCWVDDKTLFFHRRGSDGWWSIYKAVLPVEGPVTSESVVIRRVTPPGLHAFTPATSPRNEDFIAVATRRPGSDFRHVEIFDLVKGQFRELTRLVSPRTHHFNPFISPDSLRIGYHRCRGGANEQGPSLSPHLLLENLKSPVPGLSLFRIDGSFPSFSPTGDRIAYVNFPGVYVVNRDGSDRRQVYPGIAFSTSWDPNRPGVIYTSTGPTFATEETNVDIISIAVDGAGGPVVRKLTTNGKNNAFPALSPDGKWVVFRSGRSGHKNLYIMDAVEGETGGLARLTDGLWTDTMCAWSPLGDWIAFASDRSNPGSGSFELYLIHPNGTGLRKLVQSGSAGRANHPYFSPDGQSIVFTSDYGAVSAEPISNAHHYQPYGEIFTVKLDGSDLRRLTHNSYEDGTPAWGPTFIRPQDVAWPNYGAQCEFEDCHWLSKMPREGTIGAHSSSATGRPQCSS